MANLTDIVPIERAFRASEGRGAPIPWWAKIGTKIVLSRLVRDYRQRKALGVFRHGRRDYDIAPHIRLTEDTFERHACYAEGEVTGFVELGPGDSLGSVLVAASRGVSRSWLVDVGDFATPDMAVYRSIAEMLDRKVPGFAARVDLSSRDRMLASIGATYLTRGVASLREIPAGAADIVLSTSVLEHVRRHEFDALVAETFRILRPGGTGHHSVDLMDHLGGALNHLRFSKKVWEGSLFANSGFYTNRLCFEEVLATMRAAGFEVAVRQIARWPLVPTSRRLLAAPFRDLPEEDLRIANFDVLLRRPVHA
jgi:hypothetical protein